MNMASNMSLENGCSRSQTKWSEHKIHCNKRKHGVHKKQEGTQEDTGEHKIMGGNTGGHGGTQNNTREHTRTRGNTRGDTGEHKGT